MPLTFNNVSVLSANSSSEFFGDQIRYKSTLEMSIEGNFVDLNNNTYNAIHAAINAYETNAFGGGQSFYNDITVNGINFGRGYVRNFSTSPDGPDIGVKKYSINISIAVDSDDDNFSILNSSDFNGLNLAAENNLKYIQSFSESSIYTKGEGIKDSYSQNISITIVPEQRSQAKTFAENFIKRFLNNNNLSSLITAVVAYNKGQDIRKRHDQTYDENTGTFTVNSNWIFNPRLLTDTGDNDVIVIRNVTVTYETQGVINVTEDGDCLSNKNDTDMSRSNQALQKANELVSNAWSRISTGGYIDTSKHNDLINQPISKNTTSIPFQGRATYSITFTNSKEVIANVGYWSYNIVINQTQGGDFIGNESGEITGKGELLSNRQKYNFALNHWNSIKNQIRSRINQYINGNLNEISISQVHSEIGGKISYNYSLSNNKSLSVNQNITKKVTSITEDYNRNLFSTFNIIGQKEIAQLQRNRLQNNIQINVVLNGKFTTPLSTYISTARSIVSNYKQGGKLADINYNYSPSNREFSLNATYFYMP